MSNLPEGMEVRDRRTEHRFFVDNVIVRHYGKQIGPYGIAVYNVLCLHANQQTQEAYPSIKTIAEMIGASTGKVSESIKQLRQLRLVHVKRQYRKDGGLWVNLYTLVDPPLTDNEAKAMDAQEEDPPSRSEVGVPHEVNCATPPGEGATPPHERNNPHMNNPHSKNNPNKESSRPAPWWKALHEAGITPTRETHEDWKTNVLDKTKDPELIKQACAEAKKKYKNLTWKASYVGGIIEGALKRGMPPGEWPDDKRAQDAGEEIAMTMRDFSQ